MSRKRWVGAALMTVIGVTASPMQAQFRKGMMQTTTEVTLNRKRAPKVNLMGMSVRVDSVAQTPANSDASKQLGTMLEAELTSQDSRLTPVKDRPDVAITVTLVQVDGSRANQTRQEMVSKQTGTKNGKPQYSLVPEARTYLVVTGRISAALQVRDMKSNAVLDSDTLSPEYKKDFLNGVGAPDARALQLALLQELVNVVVPRLTPTVQPVKVLLARPTDEIDALNGLAQKNQWPQMLEKLMLTKPLSDPKKEPYRLYNLGVVNEALAYATEDMTTAQSLLREASKYYSNAIAGKEDEKYFSEPQTRIAESITAYASLDTMITQYKELRLSGANAGSRDIKPAAPAPAPATPAPAAADLSGSTFTNAHVIALMARGLDETNTIESIKAAESVAFDLGPNGLANLLAGKVPNTVISAMRAKQAGNTGAPANQRPPAPASAPKPAATPSKPATPPGRTAPGR